jgi:hypothetical protein
MDDYPGVPVAGEGGRSRRMAPEVSCWLELKLCHANERDGSQKISVFTPRFVRAGGGK